MSAQNISKGYMPIFNVTKYKLQEIECESDYFMPFIYPSNKYREYGPEHCKFKRSSCNMKGMKVCNHGSAIEDRTCYCDFTDNYVPKYSMSACFKANDNYCTLTSMCNAFNYKLEFLYPTEIHCIQKENFTTTQSFLRLDGNENTVNMERLFLIFTSSLCIIQFTIICYYIVRKRLMKKKKTVAVVSFRDRRNTGITVPGDIYAEIDLEMETNIDIVTHNTQMRNNPDQMKLKRNSSGHMISEQPETDVKDTIAEALGGHTIPDNESASSQENEGSEDVNCESEYVNPYQPLQINDLNKVENPYTETQTAISTNEKENKPMNDDDVYLS
ncbi:uncharacterized protein LOC127702408 [Mytilus californianus]|uniref:uncharacterized protein LOC127702408 n=1 Tax=Mytilus californianus TaxID=6549 RepID=UPI0022462991|nr:uncharacterized protein LOC127702408 [Mytilus californianus]